MTVEEAVIAAGRQARERCQAFAGVAEDRNRKRGGLVAANGWLAAMTREGSCVVRRGNPCCVLRQQDRNSPFEEYSEEKVEGLYQTEER